MTVQRWMVSIICSLGFVTQVAALADEGEKLYATCAACHGQQGEGNPALNAPVLAGQYNWYLKRQLQHFADGTRGSHVEDTLGKSMQVFAKQISEPAQSDALNTYISSLPPQSSKASLSGDLKNGSRYYQAKCGACHGGKAQGNVAFNAPKLAGQDPQYLQRQMQNFINSIRGTHAQDKFGRQMAMMAKIISEKELSDVLYFITEQP